MISLSDAEFDAIVDAAYQSLPDSIRHRLDNLSIAVVPRPTETLCGSADELDGFDDLLGIYIGVPLTERDPLSSGPPTVPDRIYLFRENLLASVTERESLEEEIRVTLLHEIGHYFGLDEDQLADLGYD